jgi:hypothetical protein
MNRHQLRLAGRAALERHYESVSSEVSQGVVPGGRLAYLDGGVSKEAAIRTSKNGKIGLLKDEHDNWRILNKVQLLLVATISEDNPKLAEVYAFDPKVIQAEFDAAARISGERTVDRNAPLFLPLFEHRRGIGAWKDGLSSRCLWKENIKKTDLPVGDFPVSTSQALEVLRANVAKGLGIHPNRVELTFNFHIKEESMEDLDTKKK